MAIGLAGFEQALQEGLRGGEQALLQGAQGAIPSIQAGVQRSRSALSPFVGTAQGAISYGHYMLLLKGGLKRGPALTMGRLTLFPKDGRPFIVSIGSPNCNPLLLKKPCTLSPSLGIPANEGSILCTKPRLDLGKRGLTWGPVMTVVPLVAGSGLGIGKGTLNSGTSTPKSTGNLAPAPIPSIPDTGPPNRAACAAKLPCVIALASCGASSLKNFKAL